MVKFSSYFTEWLSLYKVEAVSTVTLLKYRNTKRHLEEIGLNIEIDAIGRVEYQKGLNKLGKNHAKRTVSTFHKHMRACLDEAVEDGIILKNPATHAVITGGPGRQTRKFLEYTEWKRLIEFVDVNQLEMMMIYLAATTGMRYSEIAGLTTKDVHQESQTISISKTWGYKTGGGFQPTKNSSSIRTIAVDKVTMEKLVSFIASRKYENSYDLIFWSKYNRILHSAEINAELTKILTQLSIERITFHGLRHTHASVLLFAGMSVLSVSRRLGHANTSTTQEIYLHLIKEMEAKDTLVLQNIFDRM